MKRLTGKALKWAKMSSSIDTLVGQPTCNTQHHPQSAAKARPDYPERDGPRRQSHGRTVPWEVVLQKCFTVRQRETRQEVLYMVIQDL